MLKKSIVFTMFCIVTLGIMTMSIYAADAETSKLICTKIQVGSASMPASVELINVSEVGGDIGNLRVVSSVNGFTDIAVTADAKLTPADALRAADTDGYIFSGENADIVITAETVTPGETLTIDLAHTSIIFDGWGESIEAVGEVNGIWILEITSAFTQGDKVAIEGRDYEFGVTVGFAGDDTANQAASLAELLKIDLTDFDVTAEGNIIMCVQKIAGIGSLEALEQYEEVVETQEENDAEVPFLQADADSMELKINSSDVRVDDETISYQADYGAPYIDKDLGKTYIPLRMFCEALDFEVGWDGDNSAVTVSDNAGNAVVFKIGDATVYDQYGNAKAVIADGNGNVSAPHIINGRTYIQLTSFASSILDIPTGDISYVSGRLLINI